MTAWAYEEALLAPDETWSGVLNELGEDGWELVALLEDGDPATGEGTVRAVFKRPAVED